MAKITPAGQAKTGAGEKRVRAGPKDLPDAQLCRRFRVRTAFPPPLHTAPQQAAGITRAP